MERERRKELQEQYKQIKIYMGVIQITNHMNGKKFIAAYPDLKNKWISIKTQLEIGRFMNLQLQKDWDELGESVFSYEVLEEKENKDIVNMRRELKELAAPWMELLEPYGEQGYHNKRE